MLKSLFNVMSQGSKKSGNYSYEEYKGTVQVYYHTTVIAGYDNELGYGFADNRGFNTRSTNYAVKSAKEWLEGRGYELIDVEEFKRLTGAPCTVGCYKE